MVQLFFKDNLVSSYKKEKKGAGQSALAAINYNATTICCCNIHSCHKLYVLLYYMSTTINDSLHFSSITINNDLLHFPSITTNNDLLHFSFVTTNNDSLHYHLLPQVNECGQKTYCKHTLCVAIVTLATKFVMLQDFFDAMEHTTWQYGHIPT
jgi:hypothetical protein